MFSLNTYQTKSHRTIAGLWLIDCEGFALNGTSVGVT